MTNRKITANKIKITNNNVSREDRRIHIERYQEKYIMTDCIEIEKKAIIICCSSLNKDFDDTLEVSVRLNDKVSFLKRVWLSIKYIFRLGDFKEPIADVSISPEKANDFRDLCDKFLEIKKQKESVE